tara:strand:- start:78 stop:314 length:237 start_codon:yes stop_codon:yes gene_type:complete
MALTEEMQMQVDLQKAIEAARTEANAGIELKQQKMEAIRVAQNVIFENRRVKMASEVTDVTSSDITDLANELISFVNS